LKTGSYGAQLFLIFHIIWEGTATSGRRRNHAAHLRKTLFFLILIFKGFRCLAVGGLVECSILYIEQFGYLQLDNLQKTIEQFNNLLTKVRGRLQISNIVFKVELKNSSKTIAFEKKSDEGRIKKSLKNHWFFNGFCMEKR